MRFFPKYKTAILNITQYNSSVIDINIITEFYLFELTFKLALTNDEIYY